MNNSNHVRGWLKQVLKLVVNEGFISDLYRLWRYHFLMWQWRLNDAIRREVCVVTSWWRHAAVTRKETYRKFSFDSEEQWPTFMYHLAVIFKRLKWTFPSMIGTYNSLNMQFSNFIFSYLTYMERELLFENIKNSALNPQNSYQK